MGFIEDFPVKYSVFNGFSMAMLNNQRVDQLSCFHRTPEPENMGLNSGQTGFWPEK
jgi:hypothetical protein